MPIPLSVMLPLQRLFAAVLFVFALLSGPVRTHAAGDEPIDISATDQMKFDVTDIPGKVGQKLTIMLTNDGSLPKAAMAHNLCILKPGTDVMAFVGAASKRAADGYIPNDAQAGNMIVHTKLLGPGEDDTISFTPTVAGVYEYVCTFPAHAAAGMRGKITVQ